MAQYFAIYNLDKAQVIYGTLNASTLAVRSDTDNE